MYDNLRNKNRHITFAAKLDSNTPDLLTFGQHLFRNSLIPFRLVHGVEPRIVPGAIAGYPGDFIGAKLAAEWEADSHRDATKALAELSKRILPERECSYNVVFGRVPSAVVADAIASNSSLIVAAAGQIEGRTFPHGYSTSIGLMAASTLPVMVVPNHWNHLHNYDHLKVLVADDLTDHSRGAISLACEFAANFPGSEVMHLHICKSSTADIKNWGDEILAAMTKGTVPMDEGFNQEKFLAKVGKSYKDTLESRLGTAKLLIEQSGAYKPAVAYGDPFAEFGKAVDKFNPDIVVFGRHEFFHARPFGIGKMPFHAMLGLNRPVVISPTPAHKL